jgi:hypothetical protein
MKVTAWIVAAIVVASIAYTMGPDVVRYIKIKTM